VRIDQRSAFCPNCGQDRLVERRHVADVSGNCFLVVVTLGLWLILWPFIAALIKARNPWKCQTCGSVVRVEDEYVGPGKFFKKA
jgi:hypothetical protein